ncbi:hypothetical protein SDC9_204537 [bioreactor metagenome]|uniref:Uncharacterized protein n=1 Tax=bioreactor metagenome TaxID=1076179 RepID=A0A645J8P9_9ZZZZ
MGTFWLIIGPERIHTTAMISVVGGDQPVKQPGRRDRALKGRARAVQAVECPVEQRVQRVGEVGVITGGRLVDV